MQVRQCVPADVEAVTALYDKVTLHLEQTVNYPRWEYGVYPSASTVETAVDAGVQYLCEDGGAVVGAFILNDDPQGAYGRGEWKTCLQPGEFLVIHTLAVDPDRAGQGIGRYMVRACVEYTAARGLGAIRLDVVPDNLPARRLYEKMGFTFAGEKDLERGIDGIPRFALYELNF